ncbi:MAG: sialate O-acetylesterase [Prolixibacteraceae bacterium]|jgi:sialate O-acetylesterase|nr:sialate O-acetylesterase [Prolixibacteraceae bacterium]
MKRAFNSVLAVLVVLAFSAIQVFAEVKLPAIFGDNMVLQQKTEAAIWGIASKNATVRVSTSWNNKSYSTRTNSEGKWKLKVATPSAGGPFEVSISDGTTVKLKNVMIGEVWVCSGQSNMEMPMKGFGFYSQPVAGANAAIATSSNPAIRLFTVKKVANLELQDDVIGSWKSCEPENVSNFSAAAYYYGLMLYNTLKVPIGLINTSWGGSRIEPWMSEEWIKKFDFVKLPDKNQQSNPESKVPTIVPTVTPTVLYNAMINPIVGYGMRGAIWYQGESNRNETAQYARLFPGMIENWRSVWGIGDFPFYFVQIAPFDYGPVGLNSAFIREVQLKASLSIPNVGMACIMDIGEKECIHPANKKVGSDRLALLALAKTYGKSGFVSSGPVFKEMVVEGSTVKSVKLSFSNAENGLTSYGKELSCFEVAGANKRFFPAKAFIVRGEIILLSPSVKDPVAVRYAFKDFVIGDLFNNDGLPASSFRTDSWEQ